ncbi:hypothetical protein TKK_0001281 [Trichogramma kaykai]|uniref:RING-type domain-containing protein n=1 Tax=Trichogramma kaykai TaxID=54128 RepID=A0ABD2WWB9_9HYME
MPKHPAIKAPTPAHSSSKQKMKPNLSKLANTANKMTSQKKFHKNLRVILKGMLFGDLKPISTDPELDPPADVCHICWQSGHTRMTCKHPIKGIFCNNCGRKGIAIDDCPRCGQKYQEYQNKLKESRIIEYGISMPNRSNFYPKEPKSLLDNKLIQWASNDKSRVSLKNQLQRSWNKSNEVVSLPLIRQAEWITENWTEPPKEDFSSFRVNQTKPVATIRESKNNDWKHEDNHNNKWLISNASNGSRLQVGKKQVCFDNRPRSPLPIKSKQGNGTSVWDRIEKYPNKEELQKNIQQYDHNFMYKKSDEQYACDDYSEDSGFFRSSHDQINEYSNQKNIEDQKHFVRNDRGDRYQNTLNTLSHSDVRINNHRRSENDTDRAEKKIASGSVSGINESRLNDALKLAESLKHLPIETQNAVWRAVFPVTD